MVVSQGNFSYCVLPKIIFLYVSLGLGGWVGRKTIFVNIFPLVRNLPVICISLIFLFQSTPLGSLNFSTQCKQQFRTVVASRL